MILRKYHFLILLLISFLIVHCNSKKEQAADNQIENISESPDDESGEHPGASLYTQYCGTCHQPDGSGVSGLYPPVRNSDWVNGDKERLINVVLNGLSGPIEVNGEQYNSAMPANSYLSDQQIADILTFLRQNFDNNSSAILPDEVASVRAAG